MTKDFSVRFHRIYSILLGIVVVIAGICLMVACVGIYNSGEHPFSREAVADAFSGIAFPVYLCLVMTICGFIIDVILPKSDRNLKPVKPYAHMLMRMSAGKDLNQCDESLRSAIHSCQKKRRIHSIIRTIILGVTSIIFLVYALNAKHFDRADITGSVIKAMYLLIPCLIVAFGYAIFTAYYNERSLNLELTLWKQVPASEHATDCATRAEMTGNKVAVIRLLVLVLGIALLIYGFISGGAMDVLTKAANICTECIGLG